MKSRSLALLLPSLFLTWGCSAVKFSSKSDCGSDSSCVSQAGALVYEGTEVIKGRKVDVLIVNDNSASMSFEQARLAQRFNTFVTKFDQNYLDYRIAMTTSDISSGENKARPINGNGALQDGRLISYENGAKFLTPETANPSQREMLFNKAINRPETLMCEQFINSWVASGKSRNTQEYAQAYFNSCPTTDERGIYAANLVVQNNPDGFLRNDADLAIIFLADEDVRSQLYCSGEPKSCAEVRSDYPSQPGHSLANFDKAETLISNIKSKYPQKAFGLHAIIVTNPTCLETQNSQLNGVVSGSYGWEYYRATYDEKTGTRYGVAGNICASDYTNQLLDIFKNIEDKAVNKIALKCGAPNLEMINITITSDDPSITSEVIGSEIRFSKNLPVGSSISYKYKCKNGAT